MMKFEPIFNERCFPVTAKRKLYDIMTCVQFLSKEEKGLVYKTYNAETNQWAGCDKRDAKFGTYGFCIESENVFIDPIHNKPYRGDLFYLGKGVVSPDFNGKWDLRCLLHNKRESDGIFKIMNNAPKKYIIYNFDFGLPERVAYAEEAVRILWMKYILKKTYNNGKIEDGMVLNQREEKAHFETVNYYLNIPEVLCKLKSAMEQNKNLILTK